MADEPLQIHFPAQHKTSRLFLQVDGSAVGSQKTLFVNANRRRIDRGLTVWVCANNNTRPPGRVASMAGRISAVPATARMTASAPRPSVRFLTISITSDVEASMFSSRPNVLAIVCLWG